jgi:hypothetical protein
VHPVASRASAAITAKAPGRPSRLPGVLSPRRVLIIRTALTSAPFPVQPRCIHAGSLLHHPGG